jgi:hypothetical protein
MYANHLTKLLIEGGDKPYRALVQYHMKRQSMKQLTEAMFGEVENLPEAFTPYVEKYIDVINENLVYDKKFWEEATVHDAFKEIIKISIVSFPIDNAISSPGDEMLPQNHELAMGLFQIPTMNFAYSASNDKQMRKFLGIKKGLFS